MFSYSNPIEIVYSNEKLPSLNNPSLICGFPGTGFVGKLAIDYLIKELSAVHLADIFSSFYSPQITIKQDGTSEIVKNSIYYVKRENKKTKARKNISKKYESMKNLEQKVDNGNISPVHKNISNFNEGYLSQMDMILLTGDSQPIVPGSEYVLTEKILDVGSVGL
ncbi:MAG: PAC2 family protein [Nitrososphaeraceae archaeon]|nr:PAC2 family protein [Nitrososphaeraceae archaeon]